MLYGFFQSFWQLNFLAICACIFLIFFLVINHPYEEKITERFYPIVILLFVVIMLNNADYYFLDTGDVSSFHKLITMLRYDVCVFILACILDIIVERINIEKIDVVYVPAMVNFLLLLPCMWSDDVFLYNTYSHSITYGWLGLTPYAVTTLYFCGILFIGILDVFYNRTSEGVLMFICSMLCAGAMMLEYLYELRGILVGVIAFDLVFYYMYLHIEHFKYDSLTGAFNKESFYADVAKFSNHTVSCIISIDVNNLKTVNDTQGHLAGDKMLKKTAKTLMQNLNTSCFLYRVGGDEFVVLCTKIDMSAVKTLVSKLSLELSRVDISCAIGYSEWTDDHTFNETYNLADNMMYENKRRMKSEVKDADDMLSRMKVITNNVVNDSMDTVRAYADHIIENIKE